MLLLEKEIILFRSKGSNAMQREQRYPNGQPISSQRGDILTYYFKTGMVKSTGPVVGNQMMDGKWTFYTENGMVSEVGHFKVGVKHGIWQRYDKLGQLVYEAEFSSGKEVSKNLFQ